MKQKVRNIFGYFLLFMALVGALLPFLQGWAFFLAAVGVLGTEHWAIKWCLRQLRRLEPILAWLRRPLELFRAWFRTQMQRFGFWMPKDYPPGGPPGGV